MKSFIRKNVDQTMWLITPHQWPVTTWLQKPILMSDIFFTEVNHISVIYWHFMNVLLAHLTKPHYIPLVAVHFMSQPFKFLGCPCISWFWTTVEGLTFSHHPSSTFLLGRIIPDALQQHDGKVSKDGRATTNYYQPTICHWHWHYCGGRKSTRSAYVKIERNTQKDSKWNEKRFTITIFKYLGAIFSDNGSIPHVVLSRISGLLQLTQSWSQVGEKKT